MAFQKMIFNYIALTFTKKDSTVRNAWLLLKEASLCLGIGYLRYSFISVNTLDNSLFAESHK